MRAAAGYSAVVQHINSVRVLNRRKAVRNDEKRFAPDDFGDRLFHFFLVFGIGERRRLVQNDHRRVFKDRPCERHPLPLPARKRAAAIARERINTVFKSIYKFHALRLLCRGKYFLFCRIGLADLDIIVNARVEQEIIGQDITDMSLDALNARISFVSQDNFLFNTSIYDNIKVGKPDATKEEVLAAAQKAQCMEFINRLENGIDTLAGDCGSALSGGERQRVSLARAILKNAPVVILDEATAFADPENEEKMEKAIAEVVRGKTLLVIAHRLASIQNADKIYVLDNGRVAGSGTHKELLESNDIYKRLWQISEDSAAWNVVGTEGGAV